MTQFLQLRSGTSGPPFVGVLQDDVLLWDTTQKKWFAGRFPAGVLTTDDVINFSLVPGVTTSDALDNLGVNPNFPPEHNNGASGAAFIVSFASAPAQSLTLTANCTVALGGFVAGRTQWVQLKCIQGGGGGFTITLTGVHTPGGAPLTLSAAAGAVDILSIYWDGAIAYATVGGLAFA
jgi:hypothetical protein